MLPSGAAQLKPYLIVSREQPNITTSLINGQSINYNHYIVEQIGLEKLNYIKM